MTNAAQSSPIDKIELVAQIRQKLEAELQSITQAAKAAHEAATHEESKAEDSHDTRGLESSYLAGAAAQRAADIQQQIYLYKIMEPKAFKDGDAVGPTAVVEVENNGKRSFYFIAPQGGGMKIQLGKHSIQVITPQSPLGDEIMGRKTGDILEIEAQGVAREYEIISIH
jgi:transcription elongation GreA/GreB family factor